MTTGVYLLHFDKPYHHARHYLGYAKNIDDRIELHRRGQGARLTSVINQAGITFQVARIWKNQTRKFERQLKNRKNTPQLCPICQAEKKASKSNCCVSKEAIKVAAPRLSELIRAGAALHPELKPNVHCGRPSFSRGAFARRIDGQIYTDATGAGYEALWNDVPLNLKDFDVSKQLLEATGTRMVFIKRNPDLTNGGIGYELCAADHPLGNHISHWLEAWGSSDESDGRLAIADTLEALGL